MSRIVSVWLPRWPILRFLAAQAKQAIANHPPRLILTSRSCSPSTPPAARASPP